MTIPIVVLSVPHIIFPTVVISYIKVGRHIIVVVLLVVERWVGLSNGSLNLRNIVFYPITDGQGVFARAYHDIRTIRCYVRRAGFQRETLGIGAVSLGSHCNRLTATRACQLT